MDNDIKLTNSINKRYRHSIDTAHSDEKDVVLRAKSRSLSLWRPSSLVNLGSYSKKNKGPVLESIPSTDSIGTDGPVLLTNDEKNKESSISETIKESIKIGWSIIVTIVLVEAKNLPEQLDDGSSHSLFCKFRLGSETYKSKSVPNTHQPVWRERIEMHLYKDSSLKISLWDKGKQKNFMGSCVLDLSAMEKERTHEIWQELDGGFGSVHLSVTMCTVRQLNDAPCESGFSMNVTRNEYAWYHLKSDWKLVGMLHVKVIGAKGLSGKPSGYCTVELDNERVQTHNARASSEPTWNKEYVFNVYDVTSTLDLKVYDSSLVNAIRNESLGRVSIPLLRIRNSETRWYALKEKNRRNSAKGNCPRVLLEMSIVWNPVKATLRLFQPKEVKYIKKPPKFDIGLVYSNLEFVRDTFNFLYEINESFKRLFEWDNREVSFLALVVWLLYWYTFRLWTVPLLLLLPFCYHWINRRNQRERSFMRVYSRVEDETSNTDHDKSLTGRIQGLQELTLTITNGIEYTVSLAERMYNLMSFKVPFLSYLMMIFLVITSVVLYTVPVNYILMTVGAYKFTRKYLNPERTLNNDLLDFISRIPDNEILKDWKELKVPEPNQKNVN